MKLKLDENLPAQLAVCLRQLGHDVHTVPEEFLSGQPDATVWQAAARLKATHAISFANAFIAATARQLDAELVHKDPEFEPLAALLRLAPLPYKQRKPRRA